MEKTNFPKIQPQLTTTDPMRAACEWHVALAREAWGFGSCLMRGGGVVKESEDFLAMFTIIAWCDVSLSLFDLCPKYQIR